MALDPSPDETVFFPAPFVAAEPRAALVTNRRVAALAPDGSAGEVRAGAIEFVGRLSRRPWLALGIALVALALPLAGAGGFLLYQARAAATPAPAAAPATPALADDPSGEGAESGSPLSSLLASLPSLPPRALPIALVLAGALLLVAGALAASRSRHEVLVRAGEALLRVRARSRVEQTQLLATIQAVRDAAKGAPATAPPAPPEDDGTDPVAALQQLGADRAAGRVGEEEFRARREALLARLPRRR